jgi:uncharacterized protein (TIGR03086 family)
VLDLAPATSALAELVRGVHGNQLDGRTPCEAISVGALLDHIDGLSVAFTQAARKTPQPGGSVPPTVDASRLGTDWPERLPARLAELADAWRDDSAWTGMTEAGGVDLPGEIAGIIALNEVVVHGWDLAVATGQPFSCPQSLLEAAYGFVSSSAEQNPEGTPGLFGPPVPVAADAPLLDRLIGMAGRDPGWRPATAGVAG